MADIEDHGGHYHGMSLRDWFAGQALVGLLASSKDKGAEQNTWDWAADAYGMAAAMLFQRQEEAKE